MGSLYWRQTGAFLFANSTKSERHFHVWIQHGQELVATIPVDEKFSFYNEKFDYYWIYLDELKSIIKKGSNVLPNSPNKGVIYDKFYSTLKEQFTDNKIEYLFLSKN